MNCWILLVLLFCNGNCGMSGWGRRGVSDCFDNDCGCADRRDRRDRRDSDNDCGCSDRRDRRDSDNNDCGCMGRRSSDMRNESRFEARPFISYSGSTCGCEESRNNDDCDCRQ